MKTSLVVTSINAPNTALRTLASGCVNHGWDMVLAGDSKTPADFNIDGCRFFPLEEQKGSDFALAPLTPEKSYTRKNLGYLEAMRRGASAIVETDDDNHPRDAFWIPRQRSQTCLPVHTGGWVNAYQYFTTGFIYPRGLPLAEARSMAPASDHPVASICPIQQGLADEDPDVDAVYRMLFPLPFSFDCDAEPVLLGPGSWCPFNSQNTTFFSEVFALLYLPAYCSFRMTDIWRSFIAQRVLHALGHGVMFHGPTVWQERNTHDLHNDFLLELPGYTNNPAIRDELMSIQLSTDESLRVMTERCYERMISRGWIGGEEEPLIDAWFNDLENIRS